MAIPATKILSESIVVHFDVLDKSFGGTIKEVVGILKGLLATADATSLIFKNVVAARSLLTLIDGDNYQTNINHNVVLWMFEGPLTSEQFLLLMQHKKEMSQEEWSTYMTHCSGAKLLP